MLKNIEVTQELLDYIYNHTKSLSKTQKDILEYNKNLGDLQRMQITETQAYFLQLIIKIFNVKNCLEIGTFTGFSALSMALALPDDGKLITLDHDAKTVKVARDFFIKESLIHKIETIVGPALDSLNKIVLEKKFFDLIFIDADKGNYINYYEICFNLINKGALIIFDNVLWHGDVYKKSINDKQTNTMRNFNEFIKNDRRIEKFILPIGDGLTVCRKM